MREAIEILGDVQSILKERDGTHGDATRTHKTIAVLWTGYTGHLFSASDVAVMLMLMKVGRIASSDTPSADSYADLVGYAALAAALKGEGE